LAATVRTRGGKSFVTDSPFAEMKEELTSKGEDMANKIIMNLPVKNFSKSIEKTE
jgi:hypothetical protein